MQWEVEKLPFFAERARRARLARDAHAETREAVRQRPELRSTFLSLRAAEQLAAQRIADPQDREKFLSMVREAMRASTERGTPIPDIPLRPKVRNPIPPKKKTRDDPTR
ncbi:hypothetical protein GCM10011488_22550 [Steroidobacter agaridevorans]|nr:hypothetical protein GCM10011488_22550 [Steroidobacter agaridevorans]